MLLLCCQPPSCVHFVLSACVWSQCPHLCSLLIINSQESCNYWNLSPRPVTDQIVRYPSRLCTEQGTAFVTYRSPYLGSFLPYRLLRNRKASLLNCICLLVLTHLQRTQISECTFYSFHGTVIVFSALSRSLGNVLVNMPVLSSALCLVIVLLF